MESNARPAPLIDLPQLIYRELLHNLTARLPPPLTDTPEALYARNQVAIAKVADLRPVNADEADLAAQCVAARAQADDALRLLRLHTDDVALSMKLNAQYAAMLRASMAARGLLLRVQRYRHKREAAERNIDADEWTRHVVERTMTEALDTAPPPIAPLAASKKEYNPHAAPAETQTTHESIRARIVVRNPLPNRDLPPPAPSKASQPIGSTDPAFRHIPTPQTDCLRRSIHSR
jgi:hypothetical protein